MPFLPNGLDGLVEYETMSMKLIMTVSIDPQKKQNLLGGPRQRCGSFAIHQRPAGSRQWALHVHGRLHVEPETGSARQSDNDRFVLTALNRNIMYPCSPSLSAILE